MKIYGHPNLMFDLKNRPLPAAGKAAHRGTKQDAFTVSPDCRDYLASIAGGGSAGKEPGKTGPTPAEQQEIDRLTELLRQDEKFASSNARNFMTHPVGRELASSIILSDPQLQEKIAKRMWNNIAQANERSAENPGIYGPPMYLPPDYQGFDIKAMLFSANDHTVDQVLFAYDSTLVEKAQISGLTETEKLLSAYLEQADLAAQGNFQDRMEPVLKEFERGFAEAGIPFDKDKRYSFRLDTSTFQFTVSGGTAEENALMEKIINTSNYSKNNFYTSLRAVYDHRPQDKTYNPWMADTMRNPGETVDKHGIAKVPQDYTDKMKKLMAAYQRSTTDALLKKNYGFGVDDMMRGPNGTLVGVTEEVTQIIKNAGENFMKNVGYSYLDLLNRYQGTPEFEEPLFSLENGAFQVVY